MDPVVAPQLVVVATPVAHRVVGALAGRVELAAPEALVASEGSLVVPAAQEAPVGSAEWEALLVAPERSGSACSDPCCRR